jgi:WD repeat-containing protein 59
VEDQSIFDDDGWLTTPLLEPSRDAVHASYRYAYAELLHMWGHPLARLEIMKFNVLKSDSMGAPLYKLGSHGNDSFHDSYHSPDNMSYTSLSHPGANSPIPLGKKEQLQSLVSSGRGIDVTGLCRIHETHLDPVRSTHATTSAGGAVGTCERCKHVQTQLFCVYCHEPVDALYPPCLTCGCARHEECLAEWYAAGETECPAGDECNCIDVACEGQVETWAAMVGALRQGKTRKVSNETEIKITTTDHHSPSNRSDWETIPGSAHLPSTDGHGRLYDQYHSQEPLSAAKISLGNRLKKSAGQWGSTSSLRKKSGSSALGRR